MSIPAAIITGLLAAAAIFAAIWLGFPRWLENRAGRNRKRRMAPFEHARLSRRHRKAWAAIKARNVDVAALGALIAGEERRRL